MSFDEECIDPHGECAADRHPPPRERGIAQGGGRSWNTTARANVADMLIVRRVSENRPRIRLPNRRCIRREAVTQPVRLQLSRRKGFNLQALSRETNGLDAIVVTRASKKWGNPYYIGLFRGYGRADAVRDFKKWIDGDRDARVWAGPPPTEEEIRAELSGKNIACTCPLDDELCHANIYLTLANPTPHEPGQ